MFIHGEKIFRFFTIHLTLGIVIFALTACGQATVSPTVQPDTATPAPTSTATASATATQTQTPLPTLGSGPYIMVKPDDERQTFQIYDMHGVEKIIKLPADGHIKGYDPRLGNIVSPDGQWLVFYTGATHYFDGETQLPLTLKLLNIKDGTIKTVADVVTNESDKKVVELADKLKKLSPEQFGPNGNGDWVGGGLVTALEWGIYSVAWSPDSRTLAFPAQIDGLSSDVYLYDLETGKVQRAEDTLQNITDIRWSPDGKKIIFENAEPGFGYMGASELYAINYQQETVKNPKRLTWGSWIGSYDQITQTWAPTGDLMASNLLLATYNTPDSGTSGIEAININTGQVTNLWESIFGDYAIDPQNKTVLVGPSDYTRPEDLGVFLIALNGRKTKIFNGLYYIDILFRGSKKHRFILQGISGSEIGGSTKSDQYPIGGQIIGLDANGKPDSFAQFDHKPKLSISPDLAWLLAYDESTLNIYDQTDELVKTLKIGAIDRIIWRPDSQAIFYYIGNELYTLSIPSGQAQKIGESNVKDAIWLP